MKEYVVKVYMIKHHTDVKWEIYSLTQRFKITKISHQVQCCYNVESIGLKKRPGNGEKIVELSGLRIYHVAEETKERKQTRSIDFIYTFLKF